MTLKTPHVYMRDRGEEGTFTLEASIIFPWVLVITLLLILFSLSLTDKVLLHYSASIAGERAAFGWMHSSSDIRTGAYPPGQVDALYWRLQDDALLTGLFGLAAPSRGSGITIDDGREANGSSLAEIKLSKAARSLPAGIGGTMMYRNRVWKREIIVEAAGSAIPSPLTKFQGMAGRKITYTSEAVVTEPAEWIRSFELVRYFHAKMARSDKGPAAYRKEAGQVWAGMR